MAHWETHRFIGTRTRQNLVSDGDILDCLGAGLCEDDRVGGETLINVACCGVKIPQHWHEPVTLAVCPPNETPACPNIVYVEPNAAGMLADGRTVLQSVIDAVNAVILHRQEETGRKLLARRSRVEECGRRVSEEFHGEHVIGLKGPWQISGP